MTFVPAVLLTAGIAILSLTESTRMPAVSLNDKLVHGFMYTLLAVAWGLPLLCKSSIINHKSSIYMVVLLGTTAYGALLELLQHCCTLTRSGEWMDILADFLGALVGVSIVALLRMMNSKW